LTCGKFLNNLTLNLVHTLKHVILNIRAKEREERVFYIEYQSNALFLFKKKLTYWRKNIQL